ncbi:MAG: 16S rRNA (cytosine(1402)-N(4))-methyltransferase RsmH [Proteobacteria bacterium]|nr:16S rRNA (cytosine(1402)-N(4))-methyltransferase RsmH [Pseudomonadota bacterium]
MASHRPVLVNEALEGLGLSRDGWYVDGTYGRGGHTSGILAALGEHGRLLALDKDPEAVEHARANFGGDPRFSVRFGGFENFRTLVAPWLCEHQLAGALFDLGISSAQLDDAKRGFSFSNDGPLDMRMNPGNGISARQWLRQVDEAELAHVLRRFGEEPQARRIARAIIETRASAPIDTTGQLAALVARAAGSGHRRIHPATRVFQAIRIHINRELKSLETVLEQCLRMLADGGRLCVISFHSLEDRIVKRFMARQAKGDPVYAGLPDIPPGAGPTMRLIGGLIRPRQSEVEANPRARSARLRVAERSGAVA